MTKPPANILNTILGAVSAASGIPLAAIRGKGRTRSVCYARFIIVSMLNDACPWLSLAELAACIGRKDHGSALHALGRTNRLRREDPDFAELLRNCGCQPLYEHPTSNIQH